MIKYRQLCFWIAVATASTAFAQEPPAKPESVAPARDQKVTQQPVAAEAASETATDPTTTKISQPDPAKSASSPATTATPVKVTKSVPATTAAAATQPGAEPSPAPKPGSGGHQVAAPASQRRTTSRIAIIELDSQSSKSDVIRQVVEALEKQGIAKQTEPADSAAQQGSGLTARIAARSDMKVEDVTSLVRSLQGHNVQRMSFIKPINDRNVVTVLAPADTPWPTIDNLRTMITAKNQFAVEFQLATPAPQPTASTESAAPVGSGLTARIAARADTKHEEMSRVIRSVKAHKVQQILVTRPTDDRNVVTVLAPAETPWPTIENLRTMITAKKQFAVDVQIATPVEPRQPTSHGSFNSASSRIGSPPPSRTGATPAPDKPVAAKPHDRTFRNNVRITGRTGKPLSWVEKDAASIEAVLKRSDGITLMMGTRNHLLSVFETSDIAKITQTILRAATGNDDVELWADVDQLVIRTKQKDLSNPNFNTGGKIAQELLKVLSSKLHPQLATGGKIAQELLSVLSDDETATPDAALPLNSLTSQHQRLTPLSETRIFMLRHADAKVMAQTLSELFSEGFGIAPDENINAIIVRGDESQLKDVETIVELVDGESGKKPAVEGRIPRFKTTSGESARSVQKQTLTVDVDVPLVPAATVRSQIADLDRKIKETADSLRSTNATSNQKADYKAQRKAELRNVVRKTFLARQELQRAELAEFAARLDRIQQSIEMRDRIADEIIDRRVDELLDPNLKWEHNATAGSQKSVAAVAKQPVVVTRPSDGTVKFRMADESFFTAVAVDGTCPSIGPPEPIAVFRSLEYQRGLKPGTLSSIYETNKSSVRVVVEPVYQKQLPVRYYPTIGPASLHLLRHRCTVYFTVTSGVEWPLKKDGTPELETTFYMDSDHLHPMDGEIKDGLRR